MADYQQGLAFDSWVAEQSARLGCALVVGIAQGGRLTHGIAHGLADRETGRQATLTTPFSLASITKPITASAACLLAQRGSIDLNGSAEELWGGAGFGRLPHVRGVPRVADLLAHTAGLPPYFDFYYDALDLAPRCLLDVVADHGFLVSEPGASYRYSNLGYAIAQWIIERSAAATLNSHLSRTFFGPLGLSSAHLGPQFPAEHTAAVRYTAEGRPYPDYDTSHQGASLAWMSVTDLLKFAHAVFAGTSGLTPATVRRMTTPPTGGSNYALGWRLGTIGGTPTFGHTGCMGGVATALVAIPSAGVSIAVLSNLSAAEPVVAQAVSRAVALCMGAPVASDPALETRASRPQTKVPNGTWTGALFAMGRTIPARLVVRSPLSAIWRAGTSPGTAVVLEPAESHEDFAGHVGMQVPTEDAKVRSPHTSLRLFHREGQVVGFAAACPDPNAASGLLGNCFPYAVRLSASTRPERWPETDD